MSKIEEQLPVSTQSRGIAAIENVIEGVAVVKEIESGMISRLGEERARQVFRGVSTFSVAKLAIQTLANGDPAYLKDALDLGSGINESVLLDLATAVYKGKGNNLKTMEIINKIRVKKGW